MPAPTPDEYRLHLPTYNGDDNTRALQMWADYLPLPRRVPWTPNLNQNGSNPTIVHRSEAWQTGPFVDAWADIDLGATVVGTGVITLNAPVLPQIARFGVDGFSIGHGTFWDDSGFSWYLLDAQWNDTAQAVQFIATNAGTTAVLGVTLSLTVDDAVRVFLRYVADETTYR